MLTRQMETAELITYIALGHAASPQLRRLLPREPLQRVHTDVPCNLELSLCCR